MRVFVRVEMRGLDAGERHALERVGLATGETPQALERAERVGRMDRRARSLARMWA